MKPSQLLQKLKTVATSDISENLIKTLWLEKLPESIKNILVVSDENLDRLAVMADKISDMTPRTEIFATGKSSNLGEETSSKDQQLLNRIQSLEEQICQLSILHKSRMKERNSFRSRSRNEIFIASTNEMKHKDHLKIVFEHLWIKINISKSVFGVEEIEFLGYLISKEGSKPLPEKVKAITNYKKPGTLHDLRIFLGMINFYRRYLKDAAKHQALLHDYLKGARKRDKRKIQWTEEAEKQFENCKNDLSNTALLSFPNSD
ncbi:transposon Ty3-G Gag-Pol polyprotein [Trichonephila clavata]|uniref:Transposon Ty3-G Gag-Pol polyprotein n=1 Tax=Trichonephila clavata TaxID=2740835 RepID=A0A8X6GI07_TRICU|nr:transposon Ty3-G Gag-Pol polyprotein [Trichonephila clavata]